MTLKIALAAVVLAIAAAPLPALASDMVQIESKRSVRETVDALVQNLSSKGINIAARVDHAASAKAFGMELAPSEVVIFSITQSHYLGDTFLHLFIRRRGSAWT